MDNSFKMNPMNNGKIEYEAVGRERNFGNYNANCCYENC